MCDVFSAVLRRICSRRRILRGVAFATEGNGPGFGNNRQLDDAWAGLAGPARAVLAMCSAAP